MSRVPRQRRRARRILLLGACLGVAWPAGLLALGIEAPTTEPRLAVGYTAAALIPSTAEGVLPFQPTERLLVRLSQQARLTLLGPANRVVAERVLGPTDGPVVLHTFSALDEPEEHRLWMDGEPQPLRLLLERRFLNSVVGARLTLSNATVTARLENTPTQLAFFLTPGPANHLAPGEDISPAFLVRLGLAPQGAFRAEVALQYPTAVEFLLPGEATMFRLPSLVVGGIVERREEVLPNGTLRLVDQGLELPSIHQVTNRGTVPLRYGPARLILRAPQITSDPSSAPDLLGGQSEVAAPVYIVPTGLGGDQALRDEVRLPATDVVRAPQLRMLGIIGTEQRARLILGELVIPAALVAVNDDRHNRPVQVYEFVADAAATLRLDGDTAVLFDDVLAGNFVFGLVGLPTRNVSYALRVNDFPTPAEPGNLTSRGGPKQLLRVRLVDLTLRVVPPTSQSPPELRIENALGRYTVLGWTATVSVPPGNYTVSVSDGPRRALIGLELKEDYTVVVELPTEPFPTLVVLQIAAIAEIALLSGFLLLRRRRP